MLRAHVLIADNACPNCQLVDRTAEMAETASQLMPTRASGGFL